MEWRDIESAPKDGTPYLGFQVTSGDYEGQARVCRWFYGCHSALESGLMPDFWMPLPEPPPL